MIPLIMLAALFLSVIVVGTLLVAINDALATAGGRRHSAAARRSVERREAEQRSSLLVLR